MILKVLKVNKRKKNETGAPREDVVHWLKTLIWNVILNKNHFFKKKQHLLWQCSCIVVLKNEMCPGRLLVDAEQNMYDQRDDAVIAGSFLRSFRSESRV